MAGPPAPPSLGPPSGEAFPEDTVFTTYYYRAGRQHARGPLGVLCAEHRAYHNSRANVLFSDGNVKSVPEAHWRELGFKTPEEIWGERHPGAAGPPGGMTTAPPGGG